MLSIHSLSLRIQFPFSTLISKRVLWKPLIHLSLPSLCQTPRPCSQLRRLLRMRLHAMPQTTWIQYFSLCKVYSLETDNFLSERSYQCLRRGGDQGTDFMHAKLKE